MEANNNQKMREALRLIILQTERLAECHTVITDIRELARAALSTPLRNCDIGTAEEQTKRYRKFCSAHKYLASDFTYLCKGFGKGRCPFSSSHTKSQCEFAWAQMPYKEGEAK